jgi:hypothetical protein
MPREVASRETRFRQAPPTGIDAIQGVSTRTSEATALPAGFMSAV